MKSKSELRKEFLALRNDLTSVNKEVASINVCNMLWKLIEDRNPTTVHTYLPIGSELDVLPFIRRLLHEGIQVIVPKTLQCPRLEHYRLEDLERLQQGRYGTRFPAKGEIYRGPLNLILVPGLAFDCLGYRLGYGGGYYDHFLQDVSGYKIGVGYSFQFVDFSLPRVVHDMPMNALLTDTLVKIG